MEVVGIMVTNAIIAETARRVRYGNIMSKMELTYNSEKIFYAMSDAPKVKYPDLVAVYDEVRRERIIQDTINIKLARFGC